MPNELRIVFQRSSDHLTYRLESAEPQRFTPFLTADNYEDLRWYLEGAEFERRPAAEQRTRARERVKVSESYVTKANDEFPWLPALKERLRAAREVPWESRRELEGALGAGWEEWSREGAGAAPPASSAKALVDVLLELGIVRDRGHDSYDVPDLYLWGLGLKRKGGVAQGRVRERG